MNLTKINAGTIEEREWAAGVMANSDPWMSLGRGMEACRKACNNPDFHFFVATAKGRACGFLLLHPRGVAGSPYIASIAVQSEFRSMGVGGQLLAFAEEYCRCESRHIFLCVSSFNARARALYERKGYSKAGEFKDYIIDGASEILMYKRLRQT